MQWDPVIDQLGLLEITRHGLGRRELLDPALVVGAARSGQRRKGGGQIPIEPRRDWSRMFACGFDAVCHDELRCRPEYPTEAQTEIHRHTDDQRDISLPQRF
ncbi:Uncharacterised protein [Mycobacterium tuberculosis]|uniref:Uncharacterized protein n=1 Tax=Mycobacterium tuberculosis TaxID=1773 RepID=A0A655A0T7_MYCTX|nr:Uncharacterised protein [Mycobacterium tuberculosis]CKS10385.1 Uncharacterised protein [Mycobacterium tuberculosis]CKT69479.1 Uncharacterised protein [Mycobacterium tuberculosis]CNV97306.1 Uncharacterised protein [Mycobacterium tuberculosis]COX37703.1 Uncharacterised protein [Mycobacterium tuberculosis]